jgi:hypothetical protein
MCMIKGGLVLAVAMMIAAPAMAQTQSNADKADAFVRCSAMYMATEDVVTERGEADKADKMKQISAMTRIAAIYYSLLNNPIATTAADGEAVGKAVDQKAKAEKARFLAALRDPNDKILPLQTKECAGMQGDLNEAMAQFKAAQEAQAQSQTQTQTSQPEEPSPQPQTLQGE